jgi:hypothetical protein
MAFLASAYALFTVFDSIYPLSLLVSFESTNFNLDRFIVSTIRKETSLALNFYKLLKIILA